MRLMGSLSLPLSFLRVRWGADCAQMGENFSGLFFRGWGGEKTTLKTCMLLHSQPLSLMEFDDVNISINIGRGLKNNSKAAVVFRWWIICFFWLKYFLFWLFHHIPHSIATSCFTSFAELTKTCFLLFFWLVCLCRVSSTRDHRVLLGRTLIAKKEREKKANR